MPLSRFSRAEKNRIVEEYLQTSKTQKEISRKYGVLESTFSVWVSRYSSTQGRIVSLQRELKKIRNAEGYDQGRGTACIAQGSQGQGT